jgi:hypothetical protein
MKKTVYALLPTIGWLLSGASGVSETIFISGADPNKHDVGFFAGGANLSISAKGTVMIAWNFFTHPDGSLAAPMPPNEPYYTCAAPGSTNYPTAAGGDGINHLPGGGMNYSTRVPDLAWPVAGKLSTDTLDADVIRFGALIGTFAEAPKRSDWFLIGFGRNLVVPPGGAHLYVLVNETWWGDNSGSYWVDVRKDPSQWGDPGRDRTVAQPTSARSVPAMIFSESIESTPLPKENTFGYALPTWVRLTHQIEVSSDLFHWEPLNNKALFFRDLDSTNFSARFYRFSER